MTVRTTLAAIATVAAAIVHEPAGVTQTAPATASVYAAIRDRRVDPLTTDEITVLIDGRPQRVVSCTAGPHPLTIIVLLDESTSMHMTAGRAGRGVRVTRLMRSFDRLARELPSALDAADRVRIASFGARILIGPEIDRDPKPLGQAFEDVYQGPGPSPLWDALDRSLATLEPASGRRAIIALTDGQASGNDKGFDDVMARVSRSDIAVHAIGMPSSPLPELVDGAHMRLQALAAESGGTFNPAGVNQRGLIVPANDMGKSTSGTVAGIVREMRQHYRIEFVPDVHDDQLHALEVRSRDTTVRARRHFARRG